MPAFHRLRPFLGALFAAALATNALCAAAQVPATAAGTGAISLLLPLDAPEFAGAAEAVRQGFVAAHRVAGGVPVAEIVRTDASPDRIVAEYDAAIARGAAVVVGPLTRSGVAALAASARSTVPTVALNRPESGGLLPRGMYPFGLSLDVETRHVARLIAQADLRSVLVIYGNTALDARARDAFVDEWLLLGRQLADGIEIAPGASLDGLQRRVAESRADVVFLALNTDEARRVRPFLGSGVQVYATSRVNSGRSDPARDVDLNGIRFVDMPWLLQPDHPAVMVYPRVQGFAPDAERFYALGIDAFRIAAALAAGRPVDDLDGVTGRITVRPGIVERIPVEAVFKDGQPVVLERRR